MLRLLRFPIAFVLAFSFTGLVFWFLWELIDQNVAMADLKPAQKLEFSRLRRDSEVRAKKVQKPIRERISQTPTAPQMSRINFTTAGDKVEIVPPRVDTRGSLSKIGIGGLGGSDRDVQPLVRIEPDYPARASQRGIEGYVVVQFSITPAGTIKDAKVVEAKPEGIFDQAAIKAVSRWKYNPKIEEGVAVERRGVQVKLTFKLEKS
jgi:protein TonB